MKSARIAIAPRPASDWAQEAVIQGGGELCEFDDAEALVWMDPAGGPGLETLLAADRGSLRWIQLPWAGIDPFIHLLDDKRIWTSAKGAYGEPVAEHAFALMLAGLRALPERVRATTWGPPIGKSLFDRRVTIVGGGGITRVLLELLKPYRVDVTVVRRSRRPVDGATRTVAVDELDKHLAGADVVILALALTAETTGIIGAKQLQLMADDAWLVNVARGGHVVTDDLVTALQQHWIGGAALDVTDPEPLPDKHPLWSLDNCIITPHVADTPEMSRPLLAARIAENVRRFVQGNDLVGLVDVEAGY